METAETQKRRGGESPALPAPVECAQFVRAIGVEAFLAVVRDAGAGEREAPEFVRLANGDVGLRVVRGRRLRVEG